MDIPPQQDEDETSQGCFQRWSRSDYISEMSKLTPIRSSPKTIQEAIPADMVDIEKRVQKELASKGFNQLYSTMLGLPSRVRRYMRKLRKLESAGKGWYEITEKLGPIAAKILNDRLDIMVRIPMVMRKLKKDGEAPPDGARIHRVSTKIVEFDALLMLVAPYFLPGVTVRISVLCLTYLNEGKESALGGLLDVVDCGGYESRDRGARRINALCLLKENGWELPE